MKRSPTLVRLSALVLVLTLTAVPAFAGSRAGLDTRVEPVPGSGFHPSIYKGL